ncbi:uridine kinase family protein [Arthrospira platensis]|uniref:Uridine kinase n=1 Tax=Limnospira platensis NIES-46 TaxID=1236695 RepID=A0A5M3TDP2_LIMPL|nr:uridine kinase [Arthrospira platensis]AMW26914.1 uridine kinase [Arthrospira platensis YZ]MBD2670253.1 uridine kinase [Arthrospira platensis FACHB-439]MBD2710832.1 uridine kinase [Arthrospira platensis FACHB-835]MDF2211696.1 uridine kinase [Arthrospira platensis NCB002]MDT9183478.1 uridine kinase [Limnospira sp. PMC 289.06]QQW29662.1 uridine kinase [Arthrospira sp. PCC 9108]BAI88254.1 uridine kinase [Arthrospira platensis NIES-39]
MAVNYQPINLNDIIDAIAIQRKLLSPQQPVLVAISGIDASGKGYITAQIVKILSQGNLRVASINIDGWLNLPHQRFSQTNPAAHFYQYAIRFDQLFSQLVFPLRQLRSVSLEVNYTQETATEYQKHRYKFDNIDIIILEGIFLLKQEFQSYYDLSFWIECSWETALERAIRRSQEGLSQQETVKAYQAIYFPAQKIHWERDKPRQAVTARINNDFRLASTGLKPDPSP